MCSRKECRLVVTRSRTSRLAFGELRLAWHRNGSGRRKAEKPPPDFDSSQWDHPTFDHDQRLYWKLPQGHRVIIR
jgi:hypothetical protein